VHVPHHPDTVAADRKATPVDDPDRTGPTGPTRGPEVVAVTDRLRQAIRQDRRRPRLRRRRPGSREAAGHRASILPGDVLTPPGSSSSAPARRAVVVRAALDAWSPESIDRRGSRTARGISSRVSCLGCAA
jgi:hypothetical protein